MSRDMFDNYESNSMNRQKDVVLASNEFCFVLSKTDGRIRTHSGPTTLTISQQESLVLFDEKSKQFKEINDINKAKQMFVTCPTGWYIILKNPARDNMHPEIGKASNAIDLEIGKKIMVSGPDTFSLYPGQMAKVIQGHRLKTNQYLLARVYDADMANQNISTMIDAEGNEIKEDSTSHYVGEHIIIKGTETSFYMPSTGIEVVPDDKGNYVRDAVTLERLEYVILKDENGEKRYVTGPAVVFPKPTETFVEASQKKGSIIFRALELSPISGIYIKVVAAYDEKIGDKTIHHPVGEELFITGNEQMIYYPRVEHALIQYDNRYMHHAIAIPEGEGRYVLNRLTGEVKTVTGPAMYLPDPRTEVIVKRKLSDKECNLIYPNNTEALSYNQSLNEKVVEKLARKGLTENDAINNAYSTADSTDALSIFEATSNISRGVSYTKPRTITLDTKYDGVVGVNVWTGYAVNIVSKSGKREVICGPKTRLLDYDETLEAMYLSTGKPKTTDKLLPTAYLRVDNNKISDIINVQTKDYVNVKIKVSYTVDFLKEYKDKWFNVDNYVKYMCDKQRSLIKAEAKKYEIQEFYANTTEIITKVALDICGEVEEEPKPTGRLFKENGMFVKDIEVLSVYVEDTIADLMNKYQENAVKKSLELSNAEAQNTMAKKLAEYEMENAKLKHDAQVYSMNLMQIREEQELANDEALRAKKRAAAAAEKDAEMALQDTIDTIHKAKLERDKQIDEAKIETEKKLAEIDKAKQEAYAATVAKIMESISEDLVAAMNTKANSEMTVEVAKSLAPYSIAGGSESVADVVNKLMRGTTLEDTLKNIHELNIQ